MLFWLEKKLRQICFTKKAGLAREKNKSNMLDKKSCSE